MYAALWWWLRNSMFSIYRLESMDMALWWLKLAAETAAELDVIVSEVLG